MKKYVVLILSLVLITACKNTATDSTNSTDTNTPPKSTTLAERAGTYVTGKSSTGNTAKITIVVKSDGTGNFKANNDPAINIAIGNPTNTSISFTFYTITENLPNENDDNKFIINFELNTLQTPDVGYSGALFVITKQ